MQKLSVILTTFNEAHNIQKAIDTVNWADEIIVVDSFSTDNTPALALQSGATVWQRKYSGPADQKNWAIPQAQYEWVLLLDADERIGPELQKEIRSRLSAATIPYDCFWIGRLNHFLGKPIRYSGWQHDAVIRLIRRDTCRYQNVQVHEEIETKGLRVGRLQHKLEHFTYKDFAHFLEKTQRYGFWSAMDKFSKTPTVGVFHLFVKPFFRFCKHYFLQAGFLDGKRGFVVSVLMAWTVFVRYVRIFERRNTD